MTESHFLDGVIENADIRIGGAKISITLRIVTSTTNTLLLGMDWFKKYSALLDTENNTLEFQTQGKRYQTIIEYDTEVNDVEINAVDRVEGPQSGRAE